MALLKRVRARDRALGVHDEQTAVVFERALYVLKEFFGVEHDRRTERIGHVHDHGIKFLVSGFNELATVADF